MASSITVRAGSVGRDRPIGPPAGGYGLPGRRREAKGGEEIFTPELWTAVGRLPNILAVRSENQSSGQSKQSWEKTDADRSFIEQARRAQIIDAAVEVLAERGFAKASLAQIAQRAGISKGVISYHFAGKEELLARLVDHVYGRMGAFMEPRMAVQPDSGERLRIYIESLAAYMRDHRAQLTALGEVFHNVRDEEGMLRYGVATSEGLYAFLEGTFREGQESGVFRPFDVRVMAVSLQAGVDAMFEYWGVHPEHDLAGHARELADLYLHAVRAGGGEVG
ncbi:TetR/AcrR family transcriptional regulator [Streptomyces sp. AV19]|uniref:TetR/AcrR family transcriptional regulator n=1 Tax=Streptomyces sp. AV19 TaxID=2793068 RepID=UPI0018FEC6CC|nr:TetR/AcrR family transcriptional regulator [Streptomyces sp. AV19]MBH1934905.1 TetR/AcrR family transcriptional regulator [Streptomyces sp. AV19]MDG4537040.1 TetR/AcrR family transcriptional regulator [Streptomyces sp. AV19]